MNESSIPWLVVAICYAVGTLLIVTAIPLVRGRIRPNWTYGVRFPSTLADESVWYDINARGGRHLIGLSVVYLALLTVALGLGGAWSIELRIVGPLAFLVVALVIDAIVLGVAASRLLTQRRAMQGPKAAS